jgi:DNA end-binding protein Ku
VSLHQVHDKDGGRIRYQRVCEIDGEVVPYQHIDKAYDDGERTVIITDEDLKALPAERSREIEVVEFVPTDQVDPIRFDKSYYLEPDSASNKAYVLLREALESTERTAIVRMALRQKTRLAALRVYGNVLMVQTLLWNDEVREAKFPALEEKARISDKELELSTQLIESLSSDFDPDQYADEYQQELRTLIAAKLEQGDAIDTAATFGEQPEKEEGGEVIDLMEALRQSIAAKRGGDEKPAAKSGSRSTAKPAAKSSPKSASKPAAKPAAKSTSKAKASSDGAAKPAAQRKTTKKAG